MGAQLTPKDAAAFLKKCFTKEYKALFINDMRARWGDAYVKQIEREYKKK